MTTSLSAQCEALRAALPRLSARDQDFAQSLLADFQRRGLTARQEPWIKTLLDRAQPPRPPIPVPEIIKLFQHAMSVGKLKEPMLRITGTLKIRRDRFGSDNELVILLDSPSGRRVCGRIDLKTGMATLKSGFTAEYAAIQEFESDALASAVEYGRKLSSCCFCGLTLSDPPSVRAGYGPICARNWGLPWGSAEPTAQMSLEDLGL